MTNEAQVQETAPTPATQEIVAPTGKTKGTGDVIKDTAAEIENLTKTKAINKAEKLAEDIEGNYFILGGVLRVIQDNAWFEGFESFDAFVAEKFGFQSRKAKYLMEIYTHLVDNQIPWEKVASLGWTKLKDLARVLTLENVDEWVEKAKTLTVLQLQAVLKGPEAEGKDKTTNASDGVTTLKFKLKADQLDTVQSALNKAKAEVGTEYDTVAVEAICTGYLGNSVAIGVVGTPAEQLESLFKQVGWEAAIELYGTVFPEVNISLEAPPAG